VLKGGIGFTYGVEDRIDKSRRTSIGDDYTASGPGEKEVFPSHEKDDKVVVFVLLNPATLRQSMDIELNDVSLQKQDHVVAVDKQFIFRCTADAKKNSCFAMGRI